jgi:serine protease Do
MLILALFLTGCVITIETPSITPQPAQSETIAAVPSAPISPDWKPVAIATAASLPNIADVVEKTIPSVVAITTKAIVQSTFFGPQTQEGAGSGWIIDKNGIIITNNHVVEGAENIIVELSDGRKFETSTDHVYRDPVADIAVIKLDATNLPAFSIGDSTKLRIGEWVVAIGNALGQGISAKEGTVSRLHVSMPIGQGQTLTDLIETSAAINPGNSGGPLVNMAGQVIGINAIKLAEVDVEGLGFAISTKAALPIIQQLINQGFVTRPYLGITPQTLDSYTAALNRLPIDKGAILQRVYPNTPADKAGLKNGDIVIRFNNKEIPTAEALVQEIQSSQIGAEVQIVFVRNKETKTTTARLEQSLNSKR